MRIFHIRYNRIQIVPETTRTHHFFLQVHLSNRLLFQWELCLHRIRILLLLRIIILYNLLMHPSLSGWVLLRQLIIMLATIDLILTDEISKGLSILNELIIGTIHLRQLQLAQSWSCSSLISNHTRVVLAMRQILRIVVELQLLKVNCVIIRVVKIVKVLLGFVLSMLRDSKMVLKILYFWMWISVRPGYNILLLWIEIWLWRQT